VEGSPNGKAVLSVYKGLKEISVLPPIAARKQALCVEASVDWQAGGGGHGCGCGGWLGSILAKIQEKAGELDSLLLLMIRIAEAGRPGHRLRLLPLRARRTAIAFETSKLLKELEEVTAKW
jgi:hypothetical protein